MVKWDEMAVVGSIARAHGLRGEVIVNPETDFPDERFRPGAELCISRGDEVEPLRLTTVRFQQGRPIVGFEGVNDVEAAQRLSGLELRIPAQRLVRLPPGSFYRHDLVGCRVVTGTGKAVGTVRAVQGTAEAAHLVVASGAEEILIPLAAAICTTIDADAKRIVVEPPEGLLDLNR